VPGHYTFYDSCKRCRGNADDHGSRLLWRCDGQPMTRGQRIGLIILIAIILVAVAALIFCGCGRRATRSARRNASPWDIG
jgi:hypothetical protein